jgi:sulfoxide reductase catalytic subunit YedY
MLIKRPDDIRSSDITTESEYLNRRSFLAKAGVVGAAAWAAGSVSSLAACSADQADGEVALTGQQLQPHTYEQVTNYNNYYEFGTGKEDPAENSGRFKPLPWKIKVDGMVKKPADYNFEDLVKMSAVEDHTYRMRCVEAWSMVIPWNGVKLGEIIKKLEPLPSAKYVAFTTVFRPTEMPGQQNPRFIGGNLDYPYIEGLRLDEAMHPLTLLATGIFGKPLPNQNGAPIRLVVPWKYGFKGIKSIVRMSFTDKEPRTTWNLSAPSEYGFYANVNPEVDHPRWTQSVEQVVGKLVGRQRTLMFNGYADQVASMYTGMDLRKFY